MRTSVLIVILLAAALAVAFFIFSKPAYPLTQGDAEKYFLEDLAGKYPDAGVREVLEIIPINTSDGAMYYELKARVTKGLSTPCPERIDVHYAYPPKNFVAQPPEYITRGCKICLNVPAATCTIAFPEEAIIASHTYNGTEQVALFLRDNSDAEPQAVFAENYNGQPGVWLVKWISASTGKGYQVALSRSNNSVIEVATYSS